MNIYVFQPVLYLIAVTKYCVAFFLHFFVFIFDEEMSNTGCVFRCTMYVNSKDLYKNTSKLSSVTYAS